MSEQLEIPWEDAGIGRPDWWDVSREDWDAAMESDWQARHGQ